MRPVGNRKAADVRTLEDGEYYLPQEYVDRFANEVRGKKMKGPAVPIRDVWTVPHAETDTESEEEEEEAAVEGDPTDGARVPEQGAGDDVTSSALRQKAIEACVKNWKAAAADEKKKSMWEIFDETGIFASACPHGFIMAIVDMVRSGEL